MGRAWVFVLAIGCTGADDVNLDASPDGGDDEEDCLGADTFVAGITKTTAGGLTVAITTASPTPPDVGDNTWTVTVSDSNGPVDGLSLSLAPWMPLHGHGLTPPTYTSVDNGDGTYTLQTFDLIMPGSWEFPIEVGPDGDAALFEFCAEG